MYTFSLSFDAVIAGDDELAIGALKYAKNCGLKVPEEFNVLGYNNSQLTICCDPELSTIDNELEFCCNHAVTTLMSVLEGKAAPRKTLMSASILQRGTTNVF